MPNQKLENIAKRVIDYSKLSEEEYFGSVVAVLMVISIILTCVRILQECNKSDMFVSIDDKAGVYGEQIKFFSSRRGKFTKIRIKRVLRRIMPPAEYQEYSASLMSSLLSIGANLTDEEVLTLVEAANV